MTRKIIHCDADCFFAAIEMRDNPALADRPIAVGGSASRRGVISTCNYLARRFGVHSAMASAHALRLCPGLEIIPHRMAHYREVSLALKAIFSRFTDRVEPLSLDEAFLDVSDAPHCQGSATLIAEAIRRDVKSQLGITVSAGVAPNKFLAKVASDWNKPDGVHVVRPEEVDDFVARLPVARIPGVGAKTGEKLERLGVVYCRDLHALSRAELCERFGAFGMRLFDFSRGRDEREVKVDRKRKSVSVERTFPRDLGGPEECAAQLPALAQRLTGRIEALTGQYQVVKAFVKVKFADFTSTTLERAGTGWAESELRSLMAEALTRHSGGVRLLGVGVRITELEGDDKARQLALFEAEQAAAKK